MLVVSAPFEGSVPGQLQVTSGGGGCGQNPPLRWSDPDTWGGTLPGPGSNISIPACENIILDLATPALGNLAIEGTLVADPTVDVAITANSIFIMSGGALEIGTVSQPYTRNAVVTLTGPRGTHTARTEDNALDNDGLSRTIRVMNGGALRLFGATPPLLKTKLNAHANAGANSFTLADNVNWRAGDRVAISITDFHGVGETEILTLSANASGNSMTTTTGIQTFRWGRLQYPTDTGMSLSPGLFTPSDPNTPTVLDERAEIVNLSRRIVIQGADDSDWQTNGFGAHVMIMGLNSISQVRGVEFRRAGQRRAMGRYPFHWHMLSYTAANAQGVGGGQYLGDAVAGNHYLEKSSIWDSENRAVTIHGTNGVTVDDVYAFNIKGHAFFMEDGSEQRNTITNSVAMKVLDAGANRLKIHDRFASGFWLTNPDNTITHNSASDTVGRGLWNSFADRCFGLSRNADIEPRFIVIRQFDDNTGHSNDREGIMTDDLVIDEAGNTETERYLGRYTPGQVHDFFMRRNKTWKNSSGGYRNRVMKAHYEYWTAADNDGRDFQGSTSHRAVMLGTLLVGSSLNNATPFADPPRIAIASYHFSIDFINLTAINYPYVGPVMSGNGAYVFGGGMLDSSDMYVFSVGMGHIRNRGWRMINTHPGYLTPPPYFDGFPLQPPQGGGLYRYWALPGAYYDPYGYWGPAGNYLLPSTDPFYTYSLSSSVPVTPAGENGVSTPDVFYGINNISMDNPAHQIFEPGDSVALRCARLNSSNVEVGEHTIGHPSQAIGFGLFRHFSVVRGGRYRITMPGAPLPSTYFFMAVQNAYRAQDNVVIGVPWSGSVPVTGRLDSGFNGNNTDIRVSQGTSRLLSATGSNINDVLSDPTGRTLWQDAANNTVWYKHVGGLNPDQIYPHEDDNDLSRPYILRLWPR